MLFVAALHAIAGYALASTSPQPGFEEWLREAAEDEHLRIVRWGAVDLDMDGEADEAMAALCDPRPVDRGQGSPWRVYEADGRRWIVERGRSAVPRRDCLRLPVAPPPFVELDAPIGALDFARGPQDGVDRRWRNDDEPRLGDMEVHFAPVDGHLELTRHHWADATGWSPGSLTQNWRDRVVRRTWTVYGFRTHELPSGGFQHVTEAIEHTNEAAMIVVGAGLTNQATHQRVLSGTDAWTGPHDAFLSVIALEPSTDNVDVVIHLSDDVRTSDDRLELWWCVHVDRCSREPEAIRGLGITWPDERTPVASWLQSGSPDEPKPLVSREDTGKITVRFSRDDLIHPRREAVADGFTRRFFHDRSQATPLEWWSTPFTVVYVDADAPSEAPTRIATSEVDPDDPFSFGMLVRYPGRRLFPTHVSALLRELGITAIRELEPGQTHIRRPR